MKPPQSIAIVSRNRPSDHGPLPWAASLAVVLAALLGPSRTSVAADSLRQRISINDDWRFTRGDPKDAGIDLTLLPVRLANRGGRGGRGAAATAPSTLPSPSPLWAYIMPTGNDFTLEPARKYIRPSADPSPTISYTLPTFDDSAWTRLDLPHDFSIQGPFIPPDAGDPLATGGTGRLPFYGQAWYRKHLNVTPEDQGRQIMLDIDGAMAYAVVFVNGRIVGGWPFGYASWTLDLTPYLKPGDNLLAIRLDNPPLSSRWYPGGGIYRNVWLEKTSPTHVAHWGAYVTTPRTSPSSATVNLRVTLANDSDQAASVNVSTEIYALGADGKRTGGVAATLAPVAVDLRARQKSEVTGEVSVANPRLWSPKSPSRYIAVTTLRQGENTVDTYETPFGIRTIQYSPDQGLSVNGEHFKINGVCDHHDLGALGSALNVRALQRQLEILRDMGCNAIRTTHNPPAPELLDLADEMGFLVMDETFDTWRNNKTPNDYARIFDLFHEQDTRMLVRRDRNHPSIIMWSIGNEVGEQGQGAAGAAVAQELTNIVHQEDPTRPTTSAENSARADSPFPAAIDALGLNYQGAGSGRGQPQYPVFHQNFPTKFLYGSETESTISSRGEYTFPVAAGVGVIANANAGEDTTAHQMSSYDLYFPAWACSPDKEFAAQDRYPFVAGEFVWTGFDYIGEPTPWGAGNDPSRSSYFGIIDLAGFPKDRYYIYQAHWRPDFPMAHILPHWNWPDRVGQVTPVHVYTSGDEAELFLNGQSLGRKKKAEFEYRLRWDDVVYQPGELRVVAYKNGKEWATDTMKTAGDASKMTLKADRANIANDGHDLSYVTLAVRDADGTMVPRAKNLIHFSVSGPGEIVATDNGDPTDLTSFASPDRKTFNGLALVIIKAKRGQSGTVTVTAKSDGVADATCTLNMK